MGFNQFADMPEDVGKHFSGQTPRLGVIAAAMVGVDQQFPVGKSMAVTVSERVRCQTQSQCPQHRVVRDFAETYNDRPIVQPLQFAPEVAVALTDFIGARFVLRWQAFHGIGYAAIVEFQAIITRRGFRPVAVTEFEKRPVEQDAGIIAGKRTPGGIGAVHARCEANDQQTCPGITEWGNRGAMITRMFLTCLGEESG
jgi:hypothetical protein